MKGMLKVTMERAERAESPIFFLELMEDFRPSTYDDSQGRGSYKRETRQHQAVGEVLCYRGRYRFFEQRAIAEIECKQVLEEDHYPLRERIIESELTHGGVDDRELPLGGVGAEHCNAREEEAEVEPHGLLDDFEDEEGEEHQYEEGSQAVYGTVYEISQACQSQKNPHHNYKRC